MLIGFLLRGGKTVALVKRVDAAAAARRPEIGPGRFQPVRAYLGAGLRLAARQYTAVPLADQGLGQGDR